MKRLSRFSAILAAMVLSGALLTGCGDDKARSSHDDNGMVDSRYDDDSREDSGVMDDAKDMVSDAEDGIRDIVTDAGDAVQDAGDAVGGVMNGDHDSRTDSSRADSTDSRSR